MPSLKITAAVLAAGVTANIIAARSLGLTWRQTPYAIPAIVLYGICTWAGKRAEE